MSYNKKITRCRFLALTPQFERIRYNKKPILKKYFV